MANYKVSKDLISGLWKITREGGINASASLKILEEAIARAKHLVLISGGGVVRIPGKEKIQILSMKIHKRNETLSRRNGKKML